MIWNIWKQVSEKKTLLDWQYGLLFLVCHCLLPDYRIAYFDLILLESLKQCSRRNLYHCYLHRYSYGYLVDWYNVVSIVQNSVMYLFIYMESDRSFLAYGGWSNVHTPLVLVTRYKKKSQIEFSVVILSGYRQWIAGYWQCHLQPFLVQSFSGLKLFTSSYLRLWFGVRVEFQLFGCQADNPIYHVRHLHCKDLYKLVVVYVLYYIKFP